MHIFLNQLSCIKTFFQLYWWLPRFIKEKFLVFDCIMQQGIKTAKDSLTSIITQQNDNLKQNDCPDQECSERIGL